MRRLPVNMFVPMEVTLADSMGSDSSVVDAARVSFSKRATEYSDEANDKLLSFLAREGHWSPFAHTCLTVRCKVPLYLAAQLKKHQVGLCLSEDTQVTFVKQANGVSNGVFTKSLGDIANMWFGKVKYQGGEKGKMNVRGSNIRVYNEQSQRFEISHITNVIDSGVKQVLRITDELGNFIEATKDHKILTDRGWVVAGEIRVGDKLIRADKGVSFSGKPVFRGDSGDVICRREFRKSLGSEESCDVCFGNFDKADIEIDHIVPVKDGGEHSLSNLQKICKPCHVSKTADEQDSTTTLLPKYVEVVSIEFAGEKQCYDISVDRIHNFLGNGFVVHNCWNEVSRRYVTTDIEFYDNQDWHLVPDNKKQGRGNEVTEATKHEAVRGYQNSCLAALGGYLYLTEKLNIAPEEARSVLPQATMTEFVWTGSLMAFVRVIKQRSEPGAQLIAQQFAALLADAIKDTYPKAYKVLMES